MKTASALVLKLLRATLSTFPQDSVLISPLKFALATFAKKKSAPTAIADRPALSNHLRLQPIVVNSGSAASSQPDAAVFERRTLGARTAARED